MCSEKNHLNKLSAQNAKNMDKRKHVSVLVSHAFLVANIESRRKGDIVTVKYSHNRDF